MSWVWRAPDVPPAAQGIVATGTALPRLLDALARRLPDAGFRAGAHSDLLVLIGETASLPWVEGGIYIAPAAGAAGLWLPTNRHPSIALDLLEQALAKRHGPLPLLLLPAPAQVVSLAALLPVDADWLTRLHARQARA